MREWERWERYNKDFYDSVFMVVNGLGLDYPVRHKIAAILKLLDQEERTILDVGCGPGIAYCNLASHLGGQFQYTGIDITSVELEIARSRAGVFGFSNWRFIERDLFELPSVEFPPRSFNVILCKDVLQHLPPPDYDPTYNYEIALRNLIDMQPGNLILGINHGLGRPKSTFEKTEEDGFFRHKFARCDIIRVFKEAGVLLDRIYVFDTKTVMNRVAAVLWYRK